MTSFLCLQVSFIRSCGKYSPNNFDVENNYLNNIFITLTTKVYRKRTHTDLYLQWDSHHNLACKFSVVNTLTHRAKAVCSTPQLLKEELNHLERALERCKYPRWAFHKVLKDQEDKNKKKERKKPTTQKRCFPKTKKK